VFQRLRVSLTLIAAACAGAYAAAGAAQDPDPGERIMNASCQTCHDVRPIQTQAMDADGWRKTVNAMIEMGATVAPRDVPVLVEYLAREHGPLPDGPGKRVLLNTCTLCHDLGRVKLGRRSPEEWEEALNAMLNEGAQLSDEEFAAVLGYLSKHFAIE
jgi:cytochrome c5